MKDLTNSNDPVKIWSEKLDPGNIPDCISQLNLVEMRFIDIIQIFMTIQKLQPGNQYSEESQAVHFLQNLKALYESFPCTMEEACVIVLGDESEQITENRIIRKDSIKSALIWLKQNNDLFDDIAFPSWFDETIVHSSSDDGVAYRLPDQEVSVIEDTYQNPAENTADALTPKTLYYKFAKHRTRPLNIFQTEYLEEKCFVALYPYGINGYETFKSNREFSIQTYFKQRLESKDPRWRQNMSYLFWALNVFEQNRLQQCISVAFRTYLTKNDQSKTDKEIEDNSFSFMRKIRGTGPYWKSCLLDLLAKIKTLGPPCWFLTLSANDMGWEDMKHLLNLDGPCENAIDGVRKNLVLCAKQFIRRWHAFLRYLKASQVLGNITDHFARIEFQQRGSPHLHIFYGLRAPLILVPNLV